MKLLTTFALRLGIGLLAATGIAHAQFPAATVDDIDEEAPRRYTVEMIIFEYAEDVGLGTEVFVPDPVEAPITVIDVPSADTDAGELEAATPDDEPIALDLGIQTLPREELTMGETLGRLERLDAYRPLMHFGWTQATVAEDLSPELPLARFGAPPPGLDGDLKLYLNRFLHLVVDVSKLAPEAGTMPRRSRPPIDAPVARYGDTADRDYYDDRDSVVAEYEPLRYRISEDRIMKNGEIRYYDHPKIGVIAKVTRVEEEDDGVAGL